MQINTLTPDQNDVDYFFSCILKIATKRRYLVETIGFVGKDPIYLLCPRTTTGKQCVLVAAGFHGEEPAGCWGLLNFFEAADDKLFSECAISFLPLVNPTGIRNGNRYNNWGENTNNGFCHTSSGIPEPSREGEILIENIQKLKTIGRDGFLSLHEDIDCTEFYIYTFEKNDLPGEFSAAMKSAEEVFFKPMPNGVLEGGIIQDGIIFNHCDGSFEDLMFHEGIPRTACTETPGKLDFSLRVEANAAIIKSFVNYHINLLKS